MADALLSPTVGCTMWGISATAIVYCSKKLRAAASDSMAPLMGVLGAFIFAAQMINFTIPMTGSSGHLGGGLLLAILLGPEAAFLTIASVLVIQAFFFADGGLLALGCNMFNLGFFPAFIVYPLIYRKYIGQAPSPARISTISLLSAIIGLQLGAAAVVVETVASGITALPFTAFAVVMQPIHLAIGIVEGVVTASIITFIAQARPEIIRSSLTSPQKPGRSLRPLLLSLLVVALLAGGVVSRFASRLPDGLEWSVATVTGGQEPAAPGHGVHTTLATLQQKCAILPDYSFKGGTSPRTIGSGSGSAPSISGLAGGAAALLLSFSLPFLLTRRKRQP